MKKATYWWAMEFRLFPRLRDDGSAEIGKDPVLVVNASEYENLVSENIRLNKTIDTLKAELQELKSWL